MADRYDSIGINYRELRKPDPRIAAAIEQALGDAETILNVGAGTGSYEPGDRQVTAVEPSAAMIHKRGPTAAPVIQEPAEALPFADNAFDASMTILTIHHWRDQPAGLREMRRVTRGPIVLLTFDPASRPWLTDYLPQLATLDERQMPAIGDYERWKALSIAPNLPIARSALAYAYQLDLRLREAMHEHKVAFSLASGDPDVIRNYGWTRSTILGETREGLRLVDEARALDPLNSASHAAHADVLFDARRYADVVSYSLQVRRDSPDLFMFDELLEHSLLMLGRTREAAVAFKGNDVGQALLAARSGGRDLALAKLAQMRSRYADRGAFNTPASWRSSATRTPRSRHWIVRGRPAMPG